MKKHRIFPLLLAISMVIGLYLGSFFATHFGGNRLNIINTGSNKLNYLLQLIDNNYVDTVDMNSLVEDAMPEILAELDPHSAYIPASEAQQAQEDLKGSFSGIGISFRMEHDTVMVMGVIHGGPAEKSGLLAGDRILKADKKSLVKLRSDEVMKYLKGEKDSHVKLTVKRHGHANPLVFDVVRGEIPIESIDAAYMIEKGVGYIRVKSFGEQTYAEMLSALAELNIHGMKSLIVDLRGNRGGYMHIAIQMVNEFLPANRLVVYTEGRKCPREDFASDGRGSFQKLPIVVLMDEMSASASEIFAGAIQDNDRGTVVGRRSYGKGLVQQPIEFRDGSIVRLTVARYYTPSGRCIQKPYVTGHDEDYEKDLLMRYERGEYFNEDSIHQEGPQFKTRLGRVVYGGGGIRPDIFVPEDTTNFTSYYKQAAYTGLIQQFCFEVVDNNRQKLSKMKTGAEIVKWMNGQGLLEKFARYGQEHGLQRRNLMLARSESLFRRAIYGGIIYNVTDMKEYLKFLNQDDPVIIRSLEIIREGRTFPEKE
ncbi:MAG: S41 family peptidase [Bacteroidaceae bacterium]|nr:S41 family peptidase [Bacteroidaceae bacterium]